MNLAHLGALYLLVGLGCAGALIARDGRAVQRLDAALLVLVWPLYGPLLLLQHAPALATTTARPPSVGTPQPVDQLDALAPLRADGLGVLLPDEATGRRLSASMREAARRIDEIDALLAQPQHAEADALSRQHELSQRGDPDGAALIEHRLRMIRRLRDLRERLSRELAQLGELLSQLQLQAQVVRLSGRDDDLRDLLDELLARQHGLDAIFMDE